MYFQIPINNIQQLDKRALENALLLHLLRTQDGKEHRNWKILTCENFDSNILFLKAFEHMIDNNSLECHEYERKLRSFIWKLYKKTRDRTSEIVTVQQICTLMTTTSYVVFWRWYEFPWHVEKSFSFHRFVYEIRSYVWKIVSSIHGTFS